MTFYVNFPPEVIAATAEAAAVAEEGITVEPDVDLAEKVNHMIIECAALGGDSRVVEIGFENHS